MESVEKIRELLQIMAEHDLAELEVEEADLHIKIRKQGAQQPQYVPTPFNLGQFQHPPWQQPALQSGAEMEEEGTAGQEDNLIEVTSPMVGTFFRSPNPGAEAYVGIGTEVEPDTVVCIIEAMKVMNEIKAEAEGTVAEILVEDTEPVEYGQVLFLLEPTEE